MIARILAASILLCALLAPLFAQENGESGLATRARWTLDTRAPCYGSPAAADLDGDGFLEAFFVGGKGTSDESRPANYGRAYCLALGPERLRDAGQVPGPGWPMFRHDARRSGSARGPFDWPPR